MAAIALMMGFMDNTQIAFWFPVCMLCCFATIDEIVLQLKK